MERGDAMIGVAELEVLIEFLGDASHKIWNLNTDEGSKDQIVVPFTPGKPVQIVFDARR